jgi:hypothetical protein
MRFWVRLHLPESYGLMTYVVVLLQPSYMFTDKEHRGPFEFSDELGNLSIGADSADNVVSVERVEANDKDLLLITTDKDDSTAFSNNDAGYSAPLIDASSGPLVALDTQPVVQTTQASMAIDDLLGLGFSTPAPTPAPAPPSLQLNAKAVIDPGTFQQKWRQLPISLSQVCKTLVLSYVNFRTFYLPICMTKINGLWYL